MVGARLAVAEASPGRQLNGMSIAALCCGLVVMADPEGNEFCVLRAMPDADRAAARWGD